MLKIDAAEIRHSYALGERDFAKVDLSYAKLQCVNLSYANLRGADLRGADLTGSILNAADLEGANLEGAQLNGADLNRANLRTTTLNKADLVWASLVEADLRQANLRDASLDIANLSYANLKSADLSGAFLKGTNLTEAELWGAFYNSRTQFDEGFDPESALMQPEVAITVWELLGQFNTIGEYSRRCFGSSIARKNWELTRPNIDWLKRFHVNIFAQIGFTGRLTETVDLSQLHWCHNWTEAFIQCCSETLQSFPKLIKPEQLPLGFSYAVASKF